MSKHSMLFVTVFVVLAGFMITKPAAASEGVAPSTAVGNDYYCFPANTGPTQQPSVTQLWKGVALQTCRFVFIDKEQRIPDRRLTGVNNIKIWAKFNLQSFPGTGDGVGTTTVQNGDFVPTTKTGCSGKSNCYAVIPNQASYLNPVLYLFTPTGSGWEGAFTSKLVVENVAGNPPAYVDVIATSSSTAFSFGTGSNHGLKLEAITKVPDLFPDPLAYPISYKIFGR